MAKVVLLVAYLSLFYCAFVEAENEAKRDYKGSKIFKVHFSAPDVWSRFLQDAYLSTNSPDGVDVWKYSQHGGWADIRVSRDHVTSITDLLTHYRLKYHVLEEDVARAISNEISNSTRSKRSTTSILGQYARYEDIVSWMEDLSRRYPTIARVIDIGKTYEGRDMKVLKLGESTPGKLKVWVDGGIHAREWVSPATVVYIANRLLKGYLKDDPHTSSFLKELDWYIMPVVNPDGYEFTHTQDRFWRKSRQILNGTRCHGIDLNRNWNFHWGGAAASSDPCNGLYQGSSPEEAQEVQNIANFLRPRSGTFIAYLTYHAYGQNFISRWDYSKEALPADHQELITVAKRAARSITRVHGVQYDAGRAPEILYPYGGGSPDWAKAIVNAKYSYLIELRNKNSFVLPETEIIPTGRENWAGVRVVVKEILNHHGSEKVRHVDDPPIRNDVMTSSPIIKDIYPVFPVNSNCVGVFYNSHVLLAALILCHIVIPF